MTLGTSMVRLTDILYESCWDGYKQVGMKELNGKMVPNCVPVKELYTRPESEVTSDADVKPDTKYDRERGMFGSENTHTELDTEDYCTECLIEVLQGKHPEQLGEAEYHGRKVTLGKPMRGDVKKFKVYVKDPKTGNIKKVNFGDPNMRIKKHIPGRRKSFRARHNCATPGPRTKARYWSCRKW